MKESITVNKALNIGSRIVYLPVLLIFLSFVFGSVFLYNQKYYDNWITAVGLFGGIVFSSLYWSYAVVKWRIWAFERVRNVHDLKEKAIIYKLVWEDRSWFSKLQIRTRKDKEILKEIDFKFEKEDVHRDDISVPREIRIYYSKSFIYIGILFGIILLALGMYVVFFKEKYFGFSVIPLIIFFGYKTYKKHSDKDVQIQLNNKSIYIKEYGHFDWKIIKNEKIGLIQDVLNGNSNYFLSFNFNEQKIIKPINDLSLSHIKLDKLIKVYRVRNQKFHS